MVIFANPNLPGATNSRGHSVFCSNFAMLTSYNRFWDAWWTKIFVQVRKAVRNVSLELKSSPYKPFIFITDNNALV